MNWLKSYMILASIALFGAVWWYESEGSEPVMISGNIQKDEIPSLQMYFYLDKYSKEFGVPMEIAMGVAYQESRYRGPFHWNYKHNLTSQSGAVGPMQIIPRYAAKFNNGVKISSKELRENIELNVRISLKMLAYLKKRYGSWPLALGAYNTGKPCYNSYSASIIHRDTPILKP